MKTPIFLTLILMSTPALANADIERVLSTLSQQKDQASPIARAAAAPATLPAPKKEEADILDRLTAVASKTVSNFKQSGIASWYGRKFHGRPTASGETFDMHAMTAAHRSLPLNCYIRVTNKDNGKSVVVKVNDRGPFHGNRVVDLSYAAANALGIVKSGTGNVTIERIDK